VSSQNNWRSLYPFESHEVVVGRHRCHYLDEGYGPVLLMVHGNPTWSFYWRELVRAFRDRYRVVAIDHIGCGLSEKPSPRDYSYRLGQRVADLKQFVETLDLKRVTLVAHDWGGAIGMGAAGGGARAILSVRAHEHGRLSREAMPLVDPCLPHSAPWSAGRAGLEPLRPRGSQDRGGQT